MLGLRKDPGQTQVAALRYSLCLFDRGRGGEGIKLKKLQRKLPVTHKIEKQLGKQTTFFFLNLFLHQLEREFGFEM